MIHVILLLASLANAQEVSTGTSYNADQGNDQPFSLADQISIANQGKSVYNLLGGRPKITGQPRFTKGICFDAGGTNCQTSAAVSTYASSATVVPVTAVTRTAFGVCDGTATLTLSGNGVVRGEFQAAFNGSTALIGYITFLQDASFIPGGTTSKGKCQTSTTLTTYNQMYCTFRLANPGAGSHSYCYSLRVNTGTNNIDSSDLPVFNVWESPQ